MAFTRPLFPLLCPRFSVLTLPHSTLYLVYLRPSAYHTRCAAANGHRTHHCKHSPNPVHPTPITPATHSNNTLGNTAFASPVHRKCCTDPVCAAPSPR